MHSNQSKTLTKCFKTPISPLSTLLGLLQRILEGMHTPKRHGRPDPLRPRPPRGVKPGQQMSHGPKRIHNHGPAIRQVGRVDGAVLHGGAGLLEDGVGVVGGDGGGGGVGVQRGDEDAGSVDDGAVGPVGRVGEQLGRRLEGEGGGDDAVGGRVGAEDGEGGWGRGGGGGDEVVGLDFESGGQDEEA